MQLVGFTIGELGDVNVGTFRRHLRAAGLKGPQLFERSKARQPEPHYLR